MMPRKSATPRGPALKYNYKSSVSPIRHYIHPDGPTKKDSRLKAKKTHHHSTHASTIQKENRNTLT